MATQEGAILVPNVGTQNVRILQVTTLVNGVPTTTSMEVLTLADKDGIPFDFAFQRDLLGQMLYEQRRTNMLLERWLGPAMPDVPGLSLTQIGA